MVFLEHLFSNQLESIEKKTVNCNYYYLRENPIEYARKIQIAFLLLVIIHTIEMRLLPEINILKMGCFRLLGRCSRFMYLDQNYEPICPRSNLLAVGSLNYS